jgi:hypothetical protein
MRLVAGTAVAVAICLQATALAQQGGGGPAVTTPTPPPSAEFVRRCEALNHLSLEGVAETPGNIVATTVVHGRGTTPPERIMHTKRGHSQGNPTPTVETLPTHCRVEGYVTPSVRFLILLPEDAQWNERFMLAACDAWCGRVGEDIVVPGLADGFATMTNDGGHYSRAPFDGIWAHRNMSARIDFAYRANHVSAVVGKEIIRSFFGRPARYSYLAGFSKGGNAGLFAAQRYPEDFDGIFVKAPVVEYNEKNAAHFPWLALAVHPDGRTPVMYSDKIPLIRDAVMASCDATDGLRDGVIDDPRQCNFQPEVLLCREGQSEERNECLNQAQVTALRRIYQRPTDRRGRVYFDYGVDVGSERDWARSILPVRGAQEVGAPFALNGAATGLRYMATRNNPGPGFDWTQFDYVRNRRQIQEMSRIYNPDSVDLSAFQRRGGRMIIVHGWGDAMVTAQMTINWFNRVEDRMGEANVANFMQLYVVPGMDHGSGGSGPYVFDAQSALMRWVEQGQVPTQLLLENGPGDPVTRTRPAFPYPFFARYSGSGDPNSAASFVRAGPRQ